MIKQTYLSNLKNLPPGSLRIRVCRPSLLAPSKKLLDEYKSGKISWNEYSDHFRLQLLANKDAFESLFKLKGLAETRDVYLYCYEKDPRHCHRSILMKILKDAGAKVEEIPSCP